MEQTITNEFYTTTFRKLFLKLLIQSKQYYDIFSPYIPDSVFPESDLRIIYRVIKRVREVTEADYLQLGILHAELIDYCSEKSIDCEIYRQTLNEVYELEIGDSEDIIIETAKNWLKRERLIIAITKSVDIIKENGDLEKIKTLIENALTTDLEATSYSDFDSFSTLQEEIKQERGKDVLVATGFPTLDKYLQGGYGAGEVHTILGTAKAGKTSFCIQIGVNVLKQYKSVVHITLELSETLVKWKYACCMTGLSYEEVKDSEEFYRRLEKFKNQYNPKLFIKKFPSRRTDVMMIKGFIQSLISQKKIEKPDIIIIDYDSLLKPTQSTGKRHEDVGQIYLDMKYLAEYFNCPVLTPAQTNRTGWAKAKKGEILSTEELADSAEKRMHCDSIVTINPQGIDRMILFLDTVRIGKTDEEVEVLMDLSRNRYAEVKDGKPYKYLPDIDDELEIVKIVEEKNNNQEVKEEVVEDEQDIDIKEVVENLNDDEEYNFEF